MINQMQFQIKMKNRMIKIFKKREKIWRSSKQNRRMGRKRVIQEMLLMNLSLKHLLNNPVKNQKVYLSQSKKT